MSAWRVIITDSELESGVAPVCTAAPNHTDGDDPWVYDCCPGPHIECFSDKAAGLIARALTETEAEVCS